MRIASRALGLLALAVVVGLAAAIEAPSGGSGAIPGPSAVLVAATTTPTVPSGAAASLPSSAPAPAGFAQQLISDFANADSVAVPTSSSSNPALPSPSGFASQVSALTPAQLQDIYDANPSAWSQVATATASYAAAGIGKDIPATLPTQVPNVTPPTAPPTTASPPTTTTPTTTAPTTTTTVRSRTGRSGSTATVAAVAAPAASAPTNPRLQSAFLLDSLVATDTDPVPAPISASEAPSIFTPASCSISSTFPSSAGFPTIYALTVAEQVATTVGQELDQYGDIDFILAESGVEIEEQVELGLGIGFAVSSSVANLLAGAIQVSIETIQFLVNLSQDCAGNNEGNVIANTDPNVVDTENNANAIYGLDQSNYAVDQGIYSLLDSRTTQIIGQLNVAQQSLNEALYHSIEEALVGGASTAIVSYELPASLGGYLNSRPIGVQVIVTATLSSMQTARQSFSPAASSDLVAANSALAAKQYKTAFAKYQTAYQLLVQ